MQSELRVAQLVEQNLFVVEGYLIRAAVSVRLATVIITGGVGSALRLPFLRRFEPVFAER